MDIDISDSKYFEGQPIKISEEPFNSCPGREALLKELNAKTDYKYHIVDALTREYWKNDDDTLVIAIKADNGEAIAGAYEACESADEFNRFKTGGYIIIRFWWD